MSFSFEMPGQPPTTNHLYVRVRGQWGKMAKAAGVEAYQTQVMLICRSAMPSGFHPSGQLRISYEFHLARDADADNLIKMLQDAIAHAIGVNDRVMLPCVLLKTTGNKDPYTKVTVEALG